MIEMICKQKNEAKDPVVSLKEIEAGVYHAQIDMTFDSCVSPGVCRFGFSLPCVDVYSMWSPQGGMKRFVSPNWSTHTQRSRLASGAPVLAAISKKGINRGTV